MPRQELYRRLKDRSLDKSMKGRTKGSGARTSGGANHVYTVEFDCGNDSSSYLTYILNGDAGSYVEDICGDVLNGTLAFVTEIRITFEDFELSGLVYNGTDDYGEWAYFFGTDDLSGQGHYLVIYAQGAYQTGSPPPWDPTSGMIATRT